MKNTTSLYLNVVMLLLTLSNSSCASSQSLLSKPLQERTLRIDESLDRFVYCGNSCKKYFAGICWSKWEHICDYYEFSDKIKIKQLLDAEMVLSQRKKPQGNPRFQTTERRKNHQIDSYKHTSKQQLRTIHNK